MDLASAVAFVVRRGNAVEKARLNLLIHGEQPAGDLVLQFLTGQRDDGGWAAFWSQTTTSIDATCFRLAQADALGLAPDHPAIARAGEFLANAQDAEGGWEEQEIPGAEPPAWLRRGDLAARLYLTANCGFWLSCSARWRAQAERAADALLLRVTPQGHLPSFMQTHWLAAGLWWRLSRPSASESLLRYLTPRLRDLGAGGLAWMLVTLLTSGVPPQNPCLARAAEYLESRQLAEARWESDDGEPFDVHATLEALRALRLSGRI